VSIEPIDFLGCEKLEHSDLMAIIARKEVTAVRELDLFAALDLFLFVIQLQLVSHYVVVV
jgi:hypothetical protein